MEPPAGRGRAVERILREQFWLPPAPRPASTIRNLHASASPTGAESAPSRKPDIP
jgi:hypothetical protein